jgi:hypothetical protein
VVVHAVLWPQFRFSQVQAAYLARAGLTHVRHL